MRSAGNDMFNCVGDIFRGPFMRFSRLAVWVVFLVSIILLRITKLKQFKLLAPELST